MEHEINTADYHQGFLTGKFKDHYSRVGLIMPSDIKIEVGDMLKYPLYRDAKGEMISLEVMEILEERPSKGDWSSEIPTFRDLVLKAKN